MTDIPSLIERLNGFVARGLCNEDGRAAYSECQDAMAEAAAELSRLTVSPLPEEIAGLIERLENPLWVHDFTDREAPQLATDETRADMEAAAAALQRLAEEVAAWRADSEMMSKDAMAAAQRNIGLRARIAELEAERDHWRELAAATEAAKRHCQHTISNIEGNLALKADRIAELEADLRQHQSLNAAEHEILVQVTAERDAQKALALDYWRGWTAVMKERDDIRAKTIEAACAEVALHNNAEAAIEAIRALNQEAGGKDRGE